MQILSVRAQAQFTPLHKAALNGHTELAGLLLDRGADKEARMNGGSTAVMIAAQFDQPEALRILLESGADKNVQTNTGHTSAARFLARTPSPGRHTAT